MQHTAECEVYAARIRKGNALYTAAWPNYCRTCGGWGAVGNGDPCPDCYERDRCGRCAAPFPADGDPCPTCQWNGEDGIFYDRECCCCLAGIEEERANAEP